MGKKIFMVSQLSDAIDWLFRCGGFITITLKDKPYFKSWTKVKPPASMNIDQVKEYFRDSLSINSSRYGNKDEDVKIIIDEPELDDLIVGF